MDDELPNNESFFSSFIRQNKKVLVIGGSGLVLLFLVVFLIIWLSSGSSVPKGYTLYKHLTGWKIAYPQVWEMKFPEANDIGFFSRKESEKDLFQEGIGVKVVAVTETTKLEDFLKDFLNKLNEKKADISENKKTKYSSYDSQNLVYKVGGVLDDGSTTTFKVVQRLVLAKNRIYILTYTAEQDKFDRFKNDAAEIMNSLQV